MAKYILFEGAPGYALFERIGGGERIDQQNFKLQGQLLDFKRFCKIVQLRAFCPFSSAENALENIVNLSEGMLTATLKEFLELNVPKDGDAVLGVAEDKIAVSIRDGLNLKVERSQTVHELTRGIRYHFGTFLKQMSGESFQLENILIAQRGLAHAYSRSKIKFNINKADNMIIQSICLLDHLDKDVNTFSMRLRECYSRHFPELSKLIPDHLTYANCVYLLGPRSRVTPELLPELSKLLESSEKAQQVLDAAKLSMGVDLSEIDLRSIEHFAKRVVSLAEYRSLIQKYLYTRMNEVAPNLSALIGEVVGARLINHAGSLTNLSKYPASTVQILGAEKALFRALKSRGNTPKYGHIFNSTFISKAKLKDKGRISRYLANKCSIASRLDAFGDLTTPIFGSFMKQQVEDRLHFYETGQAPKKNIDVMKEAILHLQSSSHTTQKRPPLSPSPSPSPSHKKRKMLPSSDQPHEKKDHKKDAHHRKKHSHKDAHEKDAHEKKDKSHKTKKHKRT